MIKPTESKVFSHFLRISKVEQEIFRTLLGYKFSSFSEVESLSNRTKTDMTLCRSKLSSSSNSLLLSTKHKINEMLWWF